MKTNYLLVAAIIALSSLVTVNTTNAEVKRVIDQGMVDGNRSYIIACTDGQQMVFLKKYTAPIIEELPDQRDSDTEMNSSSLKDIETPEFIESCIEFSDKQGSICRADLEWSPRDAATELCK